MDRFGSVAVSNHAMATAEPCERTPEIPLVTQRLEALSKEFIECAEMLEGKLIALLGPDQPMEKRECMIQGPPLACHIHESCDRLQSALDRLRIVYRRIEL
jgi:hypothetical protein